MSKIFLAKITDSLDTALQHLLKGPAFSTRIKGNAILIKPNLFEPLLSTTGQTTNPLLIEALIKWCFHQGARTVVVGEGPSYFQPEYALRECFIKTGVAEVAERCGAQWIVFDEHYYQVYRKVSPFLPEEFRISEHAFRYEVLINLPVPKTHYLTKVSIAMKNIKGFLKREDKPLFHRVGIDEAVVELNKIITPTFNLVDFTTAHTRTGFIMGGSDIVAVDTVAAFLMGLIPDEIKTIRLGAQAGLGEMNLAKIAIDGEELKGLKMRYELPSEWLSKNFPLLSIVGSDRACSGCLIPLFSILHQLSARGGSLKAPLTIVLGTPDYPINKTALVLPIGNCTSSASNKDTIVEGCPPQKEAIERGLGEFYLLNK